MTRLMRFFSTLSLSIFLFACAGTQPTTTSTIVDDRPVLVFEFENTVPSDAVEIYVDNLPMGKAQDFLAGSHGLKVIPGTHVIRLQLSGNTIYERNLYLGEGATKTVYVHTK